MSKYHSRKVTKDGECFDSVREYRRWCELVLLEKAGLLTDLQRQVKYVLIPTQTERFPRFSSKTGKRLQDGIRVAEKEVSYFADFVYQKDGKCVVEDAKGIRTDAYIIKRKLMRYIHGIKVQEV